MGSSLNVALDPLEAWRARARTHLVALAVPLPFEGAEAAPPRTIPAEAVRPYVMPASKDSYLVFIDGHFDPTLSSPPQGIVCQSMGHALKSYALFLQPRWSKQLEVERDPFFLLNGAMQGAGAFVYFPPNLSLREPLQVLHFLTGASLASPFLQVVLAAGATATLVQTVHAPRDCQYNGRVDLALERGAVLKAYDHVSLSGEAKQANHWHATLKQGSLLELLHTSHGSSLSRFSATAELLEEGSSVQVQGLGLLSDTRTMKTHLQVEHVAPNCRSRQHVKVALHGESRSEFEGKIFVHPEAQKTEAYQLNQNLLLSQGAMATMKPNLEIFADDVKASHGATTVQFEEEELFYLRTRGLSLREAKQLLAEGFCQELIGEVPFDSMREALLGRVREVLKNDEI